MIASVRFGFRLNGLNGIWQLIDAPNALEFCKGLDKLHEEDRLFLRNVVASGSVKTNQLTVKDVIANCRGILNGSRTSVLDVAGKGPKRALVAVVGVTETESKRRLWIEQARVQAIAGACPRSHVSACSGLNCWTAFARKVMRMPRDYELPPSVEGLLAWSALFRHHRTFANYVNYVKLACELAEVSTVVFNDPVVKKAKAAVRKRCNFTARVQLFLDQTVLQRLMLLAQERPGLMTHVRMFQCTYIFLLRLPSECLPITVGSGSAPLGKAHSLTVYEDSIELFLPHRKNRESESRLTRKCWCASCKLTCPVHSLGAWVKQQVNGCRPFEGTSPGQALSVLRALLRELKIPLAEKYRFARWQCCCDAWWVIVIACVV